MSKAEVFNQSFVDDAEKMVDFNTLTKEEFLQSYSYLTEAEYEATLQEVNGIKQYFQTGGNLICFCYFS